MSIYASIFFSLILNIFFAGPILASYFYSLSLSRGKTSQANGDWIFRQVKKNMFGELKNLTRHSTKGWFKFNGKL